MIFEEMILVNFRQFYGEQRLTFATDPDQNITVIHGFNGSGKTTVLNAFVWALYNEVTHDFEHPDFLVNEVVFAELAAGEETTVSVRLVFREGDRRYVAERIQRISKDDSEQPRIRQGRGISLSYTDETGEFHESRNPQVHLERLLPPRLYPFFFFNGERIDRLAKPDAYEEIEEGVKVLLDLELFERGADHLSRYGADRLRTEVTDHAGEEGERARKDRDKLEAEKTNVEGDLGQLKRNEDAFLAERDTIDTKLAAMPDLARLQTERKNKEAHLTSLSEQLKQAKEDLARAVSA